MWTQRIRRDTLAKQPLIADLLQTRPYLRKTLYFTFQLFYLYLSKLNLLY